MTSETAVQIRHEFDRLSAFAAGWDWNEFYHPRILRALPPRIGTLLDAGCGAGSFVRAIASRCDRVVAMDLSPGMIARAEATGVPSHVQLMVGDVLEADLPAGAFDAIVSIAALHHMNSVSAFARFAALLRPGGTLAIIDLYRPSGLSDRLRWVIGAALAPPVRWLRTGRLLPDPDVRAAWALHAVHDSYQSIPELRAKAEVSLPGAMIRPHVFWRYTATWTKPV